MPEPIGLVNDSHTPALAEASLSLLVQERMIVVLNAKNVGRALYENALEGISQPERDIMVAQLKLIRDNLNSMTTLQKESA